MDEAAELLLRFHAGSPLRLEGVMTHFSAPETISTVRPNAQLARFETALNLILERGLRPAVGACREFVDVSRGNRQARTDGNGIACGGAADVASRAGALWLPRPYHPGWPVMGWRTWPRSGAQLENPGDLVAALFMRVRPRAMATPSPLPGSLVSRCCRSGMPTGSTACFPIADTCLSEARRRRLPGVSRWTRRWWMLRISPRLRSAMRWCCWAAREANRSTRGISRTLRAVFPGRCCARLALGFLRLLVP